MEGKEWGREGGGAACFGDHSPKGGSTKTNSLSVEKIFSELREEGILHREKEGGDGLPAAAESFTQEIGVEKKLVERKDRLLVQGESNGNQTQLP